VFHSFTNDVADLWPLSRGDSGHCTARCEIPAGLFNAGQYSVRPLLKSESEASPVIPQRTPALRVEFDVPNKDLIITGRVGVVAPIIPWQIAPAETPQQQLHSQQAVSPA